jgi:hypothetical protein
MQITWILEREMFSDNHNRLAAAALKAGQRVISWDDDWWDNTRWPALKNEYVVFHGSLGNANRIVAELPWRPGAFCNTAAFACSSWYDRAKPWLLHGEWVFCTAIEFVAHPELFLKKIGSPTSFFVRPDSPLKPFSGRVLSLADLSLKALDFGFYFDDENLPIVITPVVEVGQEWRLIMSGTNIVASSSYEAANRMETTPKCPQDVLQFARQAAKSLAVPDPIYVLDVCQVGNNLRLLEINPFSGADLYASDRGAIVSAVAKIESSHG